MHNEQQVERQVDQQRLRVGSCHETYQISLFSHGPMSPHLLQKGLTVTAKIYQEVMRSVVKPLMEIAAGRVVQQDSDPTHKAKTTKA